jgi:hypothetical protein
MNEKAYRRVKTPTTYHAYRSENGAFAALVRAGASWASFGVIAGIVLYTLVLLLQKIVGTSRSPLSAPEDARAPRVPRAPALSLSERIPKRGALVTSVKVGLDHWRRWYQRLELVA